MAEAWTIDSPDVQILRGDSADYDVAANTIGTTAEATRLVRDEFLRIKTDGRVDELQGKAADQLQLIVSNVDEVLEVVPDVLADVAGYMRGHHNSLVELEGRVTRAVERARLRQRELDAARSERSETRDALSHIQGQLRDLEYSAAPIEVVEVERERLEDDRRRRQWDADRAEADADRASDAYQGSLNELGRLRDEEQTLIDRTTRQLDAVAMRGLEDPNRVVEFIQENVGEFIDSAFKLVTSGDFLDKLWRLSDILDDILNVLAIASLVVAAVALVVFSGGTAAPFLAGLALKLALAQVVVGGAKLRVDTVLLQSQRPHPDTGETKSAVDLLVDAVFVAVSATGAAGAAKAAHRVSPYAKGHLTKGRSILQQALNPKGSRGQHLVRSWHGNSQFRRAWGHIGREAVDHVAIPGVGKGIGYGAGQLTDGAPRPPLSTDPGQWDADGLAPFVQDSPAWNDQIEKVHEQRLSLDRFRRSGPSFDDRAAVYQLAPAP